MRINKDLIKYSKPIIHIFRIIPSFCFCYGFNELMKRNAIFKIDLKLNSISSMYSGKDILKLKYMGCDCIYLAVESILYLLILIFLEKFLTLFNHCLTSNQKMEKNITFFLYNNLFMSIQIYLLNKY